MNYRDILGFSNKRKAKNKIIPQPLKPSVATKLKEEFGPLNEWNDTSFRDKPRRWGGAFNGDSGLTEFEKKGGKDNVNEGPAYEWSKVYSNAEKAYMQFQKAIDELGRFTTKKTGEKTDQKIFEKQWKKQVVPFYELMKSWIRGKL